MTAPHDSADGLLGCRERLQPARSGASSRMTDFHHPHLWTLFTYKVNIPAGDERRSKPMNLKPDLNFCPECEAKLEYEPGDLSCPNCGWVADEVHVLRYEQSHGYGTGEKNL
jgi:hypothetical protein